jgi:hypothetical protein
VPESKLIVACVRTGERYLLDQVSTLRNRVAKHLPRSHTMVCLTDQPERVSGVAFVDVTALALPGAWAKMALFEMGWRGLAKVIYFDLGSEPIGDLSPLADVPGEFAKMSRVMVIGGGKAGFIWTNFDRAAHRLMAKHKSVGSCIDALYPRAPRLQGLLPRDFFTTCLRLKNVDKGA